MKPTTTRARLKLYRERAAKSKYNNDWRGHRYARTWEPAWHSGIDKGLIRTDDRDTLGDYLGDWGDFLRSRCYDATGFYNDSYCSDTIRGGVVRLRSARFTMYIPCTYCTGWDGATLYFDMAERVDRGSTEDEHEAAKHEAARTAYGRAEREAEVAREDNAKYRASEDIAEAKAEIHEINRQALALLAEIKGNQYTENVCAALRHRLREFLADRKRLFARIAEREANYWSAVRY
jgi:hypothetical protein